MAIGIYSLQAELISAMSSSASIDIRHKEYDFRHTARLIIKERRCNLHDIVVMLQINCALGCVIGLQQIWQNEPNRRDVASNHRCNSLNQNVFEV
jgi:hypothetical protein